jgi:Ca-activated chloride channel homolog
MKAGESWYEILEIPSEASPEEIRLAYFEQARQYHPDANPGKLAKEWFFQVQEAYETLSDPEKRKEYDESLKNRKKIKDLAELSIIYSTNAIPRINEMQVLYAMIELKSILDSDKPKATQNHLCLIIDCSTSMKGERIEMIKENVLRLFSSLKSTDFISIILFNDKAELLLTPTRVNDVKQLSERMNIIKCSGGTEIFNGLKAGFDLLWGSTSSDSVKQILLLTDGHTYGDEENCYDLAKKMKSRGISLSTLGIGHEWNDNFLDLLAGITGGCSTFISNAEDLKSYVKNFGDSLSIIAARNLSLDFQSESGITLTSIFRLQPDIAEIPIEKPIPLGEIYENKLSKYLLTFSIEPINENKKSILIAKGKIRFEVASSSIGKTKLYLNLVLPVFDENVEDNPPKEIFDALSGITVYKLQEKANMDVKSGNLDQAIDRLGHISTQLLKLGKPNLARKALKEAELLKTNKKYSVDGDKQLKYGTRALLAPEIEKRES